MTGMSKGEREDLQLAHSRDVAGPFQTNEAAWRSIDRFFDDALGGRRSNNEGDARDCGRHVNPLPPEEVPRPVAVFTPDDRLRCRTCRADRGALPAEAAKFVAKVADLFGEPTSVLFRTPLAPAAAPAELRPASSRR